MTRVLAGGVVGALAVAVVVAGDLSCLSVDEPTSAIPRNVCSQTACSVYGTTAPATCGEGGACEVAADTSKLILVISLPSDAPFAKHGAVEAPSAQYVIPYDHLGDCSPRGPTFCDPSCVWPGCAVLPQIANVNGGYLAAAAIQFPPDMTLGQNGIGFFLGNVDPTTGLLENTLLPATATYRMVRDPWMTPLAALGLPVQPVIASQTVLRLFAAPGPFHGPSYGCDAFLPPGEYERTVVPDPPYDAIFGPAIDRGIVLVAGQAPSTTDVTTVSQFDLTSEQGTTMALPTFKVSRQDGLPLDGWTAYLRDINTGRTISNVRTLSGTSATFQLLTFRGLPETALWDAVLVTQPPPGTPLPTGVFPGVNRIQLPSTETYPALPPPISVTGSITGPGDAPVDADVEFEGLAFTNGNGATLSYTDFEFNTTAQARSSGSGTSQYRVTLPQGEYRVTVRPVVDSDTYADASMAPALYVTTLLVDDRVTLMDFPQLPPMRKISGTAVIADGRPLIGATVQAIPVGCDQPPDLADGGSASRLKQLGDTPSCLPRPQQTLVTDPKGIFSLLVDPGGYQLRVQPAEGTGFPWVTRDLLPSAAGSVRTIVPAPFHTTFQIVDVNDVPVVRALVKAFLVPAAAPDASTSAPAVELGETLTDGSGQCDLYLDLALSP
jgi:hypothetical protein